MEIEIYVADDGCGFDASQPGSGIGLASMRIRASRMGARLDILAHPGKGTEVHLTIACKSPGPAGVNPVVHPRFGR